MHHYIRHPPIVWRHSHIIQQHLLGGHDCTWRLRRDVRLVAEAHLLAEDEVAEQQPVSALHHLLIIPHHTIGQLFAQYSIHPRELYTSHKYSMY